MDFSVLDRSLQEILAHWQTACAERGTLPGSNDMGLSRLRGLISHIALVDVLTNPYDYRYRIVGEYVVEMMGFNRTGKKASEIFPQESMATTEAMVSQLFASQKPIACSGKMTWVDRDHQKFQALCLPLANDGETVDMAIMAFHFSCPPEGRRF